MKQAIDAFEEAAGKLKAFKGGNAALQTPKGRQAMAASITAGQKIDAIGEPLSQDYRTAATQLGATAIGQIEQAISFAPLCSTRHSG